MCTTRAGMRLILLAMAVLATLPACGPRSTSRPASTAAPDYERTPGGLKAGGYHPAWGALLTAEHAESEASRLEALARAKASSTVGREQLPPEDWVAFDARAKRIERRIEHDRERRAKTVPRGLASLQRALEDAAAGRRDPSTLRSMCRIELTLYRDKGERFPAHDALADELDDKCGSLAGAEAEYCQKEVDRHLAKGWIGSAVMASDRPGCPAETVAKVAELAVHQALSAPAKGAPCNRVDVLLGARWRAPKAGKPELEAKVQGELDKVQPACDAFLRDRARVVAAKPWALAMLERITRRLSPDTRLATPPSPVALRRIPTPTPEIVLPFPLPECVGGSPNNTARPGANAYRVSLKCTEETVRDAARTFELKHSDVKTKVFYFERVDGTTEKVVTTSPSTRTERITLTEARWRFRLDVSVSFASERVPDDHFGMVFYLPWSAPSAGGRQFAGSLPGTDAKELRAAILKNAQELADIDRTSRVTVLRGRLEGRDAADRDDAAVELLALDPERAVQDAALRVLGDVYGLDPAAFAF